MEKELEAYEQILDTVKRMEKAGTLDKFMEGIEPVKATVDSSYVNSETSYERMKDMTMFFAAQQMHIARNAIAVAKHWAGVVDERYKYYKEMQKIAEIRNPDVLQFVKDYESDMEEGEE